MKHLLHFALLAVMGTGFAMAQAPNSLTSQETQQGWILLFDGKTLNGWENHGDVNPWKVVDGAISTDGTPNSWLGTTKEFGDYVLRIEFRAAANTNSGIFLRSNRTQGQPHITGYELQIWDFQPQGYLTGALVGTAKANPHINFKANQWNAYEITCRGDRYQVLLNGQQVNDVHDGKSVSGVIGLQSNSNAPIAFRNIKLRELK
jgi:3-keto-disaccharide hydrolase